MGCSGVPYKPSLLCSLFFLGAFQTACTVTLRDVADGRTSPNLLPQIDDHRAEIVAGQCNVCNLGDDKSARLFIRGRKDGLGTTVHSAICGMAVAARCGFRFGGMLQGLPERESHDVHIAKTMQDFFGLSSDDNILVLRSSLHGPIRLIPKDDLEDHRRYPASANVLFNTTTPQYWIGAEDYGNFLNPVFLRALTAQVMPGLMPRVALFRPGAPSVAMHIRRGDVSSGDANRYTPDEWYLQTARLIREALPDADIHAWSSTEGSEQTITDFKNFTDNGIAVHLDGDPLDAWAHFAAAQVLVLARGTFSRVPALLSSGCVVYQRGAPPDYVLPRWVDGTKVDRRGYSDDLASCIRRGTARLALSRSKQDLIDALGKAS